MPPTETGGLLTGTGRDGSGTVTVGVVVVVPVVPLDTLPGALPVGVDVLPPPEAVTGRPGRPGTEPRGSDGNEGDVEPAPVAPVAAAVTPLSGAAIPLVPDNRVLAASLAPGTLLPTEPGNPRNGRQGQSR